MGQITAWTEDRIEKLKKLWADGHSASVIADRIGVSRSSVLGKVHRLKLSGREEARREPVKRKAYTRVRPVPPPKPRAPKPVPVFGAQPPQPLPPEPPGVATVMSLVDLEPHHCRWPIGDPRHAGFGYCGAEKVAGVSYCAGHMVRAYRQVTVAANRAPVNLTLVPQLAPKREDVS